MSESEVARLEREIKERTERLTGLSKTVTREQIEGMTPRQVADLDPVIVKRAMEATA